MILFYLHLSHCLWINRNLLILYDHQLPIKYFLVSSLDILHLFNGYVQWQEQALQYKIKQFFHQKTFLKPDDMKDPHQDNNPLPNINNWESFNKL